MVFNASIALTWILFLALFPAAFFWLRRAWRIAVKRDYSEVALRRGVAPESPEKYAPYTAAINLLAGVAALYLIFGVLIAQLDYKTWTSTAGVTIWLKLIGDFIVSRHAHPIVFGKKKNVK